MEDEIDLGQYWMSIRKRWKMIIFLPVVLAIVAGIYVTMFVTPQYAATTTILVNQHQNNPQMQYQSIMTNQALISTYSDIAKSKTVEKQVISDLNLSMTASALDNMITVSSPDNSEVIQIGVTSSSPALSVQIANDVASVFQERAGQIMDLQDVQVLDKAVVPSNPNPVSPHKKKDVVMAFVLGLVLAVFLSILLDTLDSRLRTDSDVERYLQLPVLGTIADFGDMPKQS